MRIKFRANLYFHIIITVTTIMPIFQRLVQKRQRTAHIVYCHSPVSIIYGYSFPLPPQIHSLIHSIIWGGICHLQREGNIRTDFLQIIQSLCWINDGMSITRIPNSHVSSASTSSAVYVFSTFKDSTPSLSFEYNIFNFACNLSQKS